MEIERLLRLDDEALLFEENIPVIRSLSMSRNLAYHIMEEVPHMIKFPVSEFSETTPWRQRRQEIQNQNQNRPSSSSLKPARTLSCDQMFHPFTLKTPIADEDSEDFYFSPVEVTLPSIRGVKKNELLTAIVVSRWDNIVGPQCLYLWTEEVTSVFHPSVLPPQLSGVVKYVTEHTVDHQDVDHRGTSSTRTTLCIVSELNLVYISISIRVPSEMDTILEFASSSSMTANDPDQPATSIPHAIAVLADLKFLSHFMLLRPLVISWLNEFAPKIGVLVCKNKLQCSMVNSWCAELCKTMTAVKTCWIQDGVLFPHGNDSRRENGIKRNNQDSCSSTNSSNNNEDSETNSSSNASSTSSSSQNFSEVEYLPPNLKNVSKSSWASLLTSHLSTFGSSIIVGFDNVAVNQVIRFLLCFSSREEGYCSRYSLPILPDTFMKGLLIQGLTLGGIGERSISYNQIVSNRLPITKIELGSKFTIKKMQPRAHRACRTNLLMQELRALWTSSAFISPPDDPYPDLVKEAGRFVTQFIEDLSILPLDRRYGRLLLFRRLIHSKAMTLITYLHSIRHLPRPERGKMIKGIPEIFSMDLNEYTIIQVTAEKLKPGILRILYSS